MKYYRIEHRGGRRQGTSPDGESRPRKRVGNDERTTEGIRKEIKAWFSGRIPAAWPMGETTILVDDDEILVIVPLAEVDLAADAAEGEKSTARQARISGFREDTREQRMRIAEEAQSLFGRHVAWGAGVGDTQVAFTTASVPVMTRLRINERLVLDTLIDAGVARSRSDALAWCVRLVERNQGEWIDKLRAAFAQVETVRAEGPLPDES